MAALLMTRAESAIMAESDPMVRIDVALEVVLNTFGSHRRLTRLFLVDAVGAGRELNEKMLEIRREFSEMIARHLQDGVSSGAIPPIDVRIAAMAWFGAINEVVLNWVLEENPSPLEVSLPTLRVIAATQCRRDRQNRNRSGAMIMHVDEAIGIDRLLYAFERAQDKARREKRPILASITMPIPFRPASVLLRRGGQHRALPLVPAESTVRAGWPRGGAG